jgi:hypothetical protein
MVLPERLPLFSVTSPLHLAPSHRGGARSKRGPVVICPLHGTDLDRAVACTCLGALRQQATRSGSRSASAPPDEQRRQHQSVPWPSVSGPL